MPRPGISVTLLDTPGAISVPQDTGTWFVAGQSDRGPVTPALVTSLNDFVIKFGDRVSYSVLYDAIDVFFREGGNRAYIGRVVGPGATSGTLNLLDNVAAVSLVVTAIGPGAWSSSYKVSVTAGGGGGTYQINVLDANNNVLENSGDLPDQNAAVLWSQYSQYIRITLGASALNPQVAAASALSAGNDDRNNITDTQWQTALDKFTTDLGPGQVSAPGRTSTTAYSQLTGHASTHSRVALLDGADTATVATLTAAAAATRSRYAAMFAPWVIVPGVTGGTTRSVPPSALIAGLIAKNDPALGTNRPSAGKAGISSYATDVSKPAWTDSDRATLNTAGVNVIRNMFGGVRVYGWRSLTNPTTDLNWIDFANARLYMQLVAELGQVGENYLWEEIDGQNGETINGFHDALSGVLLDHFNAGELFGDSADTAYAVDTGPGVNTLATIANLELHAVCYVKMAPFAEYVAIQIVKRQVTEAVV